MNGTDWANILNEDDYDKKWTAMLADIGIFPTEKIYGKDIQTPTIGIAPGEPGFDWGKITPPTEEEKRETEELQARKREEERIKREKAKYGGVTFEEYKRRIQAGWKFLGPKEGFRGGKWMSPRLAAAGGGPGPRKPTSEQEKYPELLNYDKEVSKFMRSREYQSYEPSDKLKFYEIVQGKRNQIKDRTDKKLQIENVAREKLEAKIPPEQMRIYIKAVDTGQMSRGALAYILAEQGYPDDYIDNITAGLRDRLTPDEQIKIENQRRKWEAEDKEYPYDEVVKLRQQYQETEDYTLYAAGLQNLGLTKDERNELLPVKLSALEELDVIERLGEIEEEKLKRKIRTAFLEINPEMSFEGWDYGKWKNAEIAYLRYEEEVKAGNREQARDDLDKFVKETNIEFKTEQATVKQQNWVTERRDKLDTLEIKKEQWILDFGAERAQELFDNEQTTLDYLEKVRAAESNEAITKDRDLKNYEIAGIKEEHSWVQAQHTMGWKDDEANRASWEFIQTMDWNKEKEETRAREFGQTYRLDVAQEAAIQDRFEQTLTKEYTNLNIQIGKLGLAKEVETRLAQTASFTAMMEIKKYGLAEAKQRLEGIKARKEWIFKERYWQLDSAEAETAMFKIMSDIYNDAKKIGIQQALADANIDIMYKKLEGIIPTIELSSDSTTTLSNMPEYQDYAIKAVRSAYNDKTGKFYQPSRTEINELSDFLFGAEKDEEREQIRFGVNLNTEDYIEQCLNTFGWSDELKGWCIKNRDDSTMWNTTIATGTANGSYIPPEIEEAIKKPGWFDRGLGGALRGIGETFKNWFSFTEPVAPGVELTPRVTRTGNIATDAENILTQYGEEISRSDMRKHLSDMGYNETEINTILGG